MTEISARNRGGLISIDESSVSFADRDVRISWSRFELSLRDSTGDEVLDAESGAFEAELSWNDWDPQAPYGGERVSDGVVTLHPETRAPEALIRAGGFDSQIAFPDQNVVVDFTEPVVGSEVEDAMALYVDDEPIDYEFRALSFNELEIDGQARPLVLRATLTPTEPLPLGPCSSLYPYRVEPHVVTIDMKEAAGRSVYLRIENRPDDVIRPYSVDIASQPDVRIAAAIDELWLESE